MAKAVVLDGPVLCMHQVNELQPHGDTPRRLSSETCESAGTWDLLPSTCQHGGLSVSQQPLWQDGDAVSQGAEHRNFTGRY